MKTTGDGTIAVFDDAVCAVHAAFDAQQELASETWSTTGPLLAGIGLHTGVAESRDGDYFGPTLNRTARPMAIGHGGQVLMSGSRPNDVRDTAASTARPRRAPPARPARAPEHVFQVVVPGQPAEFPPLHSLTSARRTSRPS